MTDINRIDLSQEAVGKAAKVADGFWVIATEHHPGGSKGFPAINNRCLVMRLEEAGKPVLVVFNGVDRSAIAEVQRLERETGLPVKYIVSPGGGHHFLMPPWHEAFTEAQILVPPTRIPRTKSGQELLKKPRVTTLDAESPLSQFAGQIDVVLFRGLLGMHDHPAPAEGGSDGFFTVVGTMFKMMFSMTDPIDELWIHHRATGTVVGGENLGWMYPAASLAKQPMMLRSMVKPDRVYVFETPRKIADKAAVASYWKQILQWPAKTVMTYHDPAGHAFHGDGQAALQQAAKAAGQVS